MTKIEYTDLVGRYFALEVGKDSILRFSKIDEKLFNKLSDASREIRWALYFKWKLQQTIMNYDDFMIRAAHHSELLVPSSKKKNFNLEIARNDMNRTFTNFITSLKSLVELTEKSIEKSFGGSSSELQDFKTLTNQWYDGILAYRFFVRLRHFTAHYSDAIWLRVKSNSQEIHFMPYLNKAYISRMDEIGKKLSTDLKNLPEEIELMPLMIEIQEFLNDYLKNVLKVVKNKFENSAQYLLKKKSGLLEDQALSLHVGKLLSVQGAKLNFESTVIEHKQAEYFLSIMNNEM